MRAKFRCNSVKYYGDEHDAHTPREYELSAVYDSRTEENRRFAKATPMGNLSIRVDNPYAQPLIVGEEYYLDFTPTSLARQERTPETMGNVHDHTREAGYDTQTGTPKHAAPDVAAGIDPYAIPANRIQDAAPEPAPSSKGYTEMTTTQPMDPAEVTAEAAQEAARTSER